MFAFLKSNPVKKLHKQYENKLAEAMQAQRDGDMKKFASLTGEAEEVLNQIDLLSSKK